MNDLNPAEQELSDRLQRQARSVDVGDTPLATVVRRGRQRTDRRRVAVGLAAVVTLAGAAVGTIQLLSQPTTHKVVPATDVATDAATPNVSIAEAAPGDDLTPVNRIDSNLTWNIVEPGSAEALGSLIWDNSAIAGQSAPYLAWSTSPGKTQQATSAALPTQFIPTLYRSDDGIHWQPAGGESFNQPDISMRGTGSRKGRMFAFGTAAATAPIPNGGGGEVVVDVSDDQGASWNHITLPIDLRGLASSEGVQSVGFQGDMVASDAGIVALGVPNINIDPSLYDTSGGYIAQRDGAILVTYPTCSRDETVATVIYGVGYSNTSAPPSTAPVDTAAADATTTNVGAVGQTPSATCAEDGKPQQSDVIPWRELGVDATAVAAMFAPRVFVSTDGETFTEGVFPPLPDGYQMNQVDVSTTLDGFVATAQLYNPIGTQVGKLYRSTDGLTWTESDMPAGQYNSINILSDGTVVAFGVSMTGQPFSAVSSDGVEWSKMSLASLIDAADGHTAQLNVWQAGAGPGGITVVAGIDVDAAVEAGGLSIEKDGVRLTMTESRFQALVATDLSTGVELGRWDGRTPPEANAVLGYDDQGGYRLLDADGTVRVRFTDADMQSLYQQQSAAYQPKSVILHSTDGINWSRDDVRSLVGFDSYGVNRVQVTASNVLVSMTNPNNRDAQGIPSTVVLVGTSKS
jgi:hypothetical protein